MTIPMTPSMFAKELLNGAHINLTSALNKMGDDATVEELLTASHHQTELAKAVALLEISVQLQPLSALVLPGNGVSYGLGELVAAIKTIGRVQ